MKKTTFYNIHEKLGAKMVEFAGYYMPIQYNSIIAEHKAVRNAIGVFDVSHMGEVFVTGEKALDFVQHITVNDASKLYPGRVQYSAMLYPDGGIVDDLLVYKFTDEKFLLVINASNIEKDFNWMQQNNKFGVELSNQSDEYSLLAVQGPFSKEVVQAICDKELDMEYYHFFESKVAGIDMIISRTGYTGEIGYELYFKGTVAEAEKVWNKVFEAGEKFGIKPAGLGCRDSLRLEMGYCLYGNDIDATTNPLEANLGWITKINKGDFIGRDVLLKVKAEGLKRKLVPISSDEKVFPRHGYDLTIDGKKIGAVTSGTVSPTTEKPIALGYVDFEYSKEGSTVNFFIRGKEVPAKVVSLPFVKK
ncbi:MAG: glycine cleavage system protein T [Ignavibacteria bacterium CG2_30_36_16]|nr:glycine cleavage system aminomethyltransferase GcvT [Ignavibacteria bacterium]OIP61046.1 MAG: glycine cleavage system protein T [Ignavibacteria bacterium CG2_30_36_16]PJB00215.1 MAG: glycine cleavage system protein T [Ignavibacteria bacterium CG_4_9_14_3_um_filter_36_18]